MPYKVILVPVDGTEAARPAIQTAFLAADGFDSHVVGFHVRADSKDAVPLLGEGMSGAMIEEIIELAEQEAAKRAAKAREMFSEYCAKGNVPMIDKAPGPDKVTAAWVEESGREDEAVARRGRLCDLIVVARPTSEGESPSTLTRNAALFETGRPVLVAPPTVPQTLARRIAIFWNGSAQAARAVAGSVPFLTHPSCEKVTILTAESEFTSSAAAQDLAAYLGWRGVIADTQTVTPAARAVGAALLAACVDADMLIMGAYTHSRLRQLIMGGVTKHVLAEARLPVLMGH